MSFLARGAKLLVYTSRDQRVREWDLTAWQEVRSWQGPPNNIEWTASLSQDERFFLLAQREGEFCRIYDLANGGQSRTVSDIRRIESGAIAPDGDTFAICSALGFVSLRETATLKEIARFSGFTRAIISVTFSPDGKRLVGAGADVEAVKMWDLESRQELLTLEGAGAHFRKSAFSADGSVIGWLNQRGQLHLWRAPSWAEIEAAEKLAVESSAP